MTTQPSGESRVRRSSGVARKVKASTAGATLGGALAACIVWLLDYYAFRPGVAGDVPAPIEALLMLLLPALVAFASGYSTHKASGD